MGLAHWFMKWDSLLQPMKDGYLGLDIKIVMSLGIPIISAQIIIFWSKCSQLRNLEKAFGGNVRVCDRTALILDIFDQRAATREAALQVILFIEVAKRAGWVTGQNG